MSDSPSSQVDSSKFVEPHLRSAPPLKMVETAFLASAASLIYFINYYFPLGPLLQIFFPVPIALLYLRWGSRTAWMGALVSGLLLSVLMGPTRSIVYVVPYGLMGVLLGATWKRRSPWIVSIGLAALLGAFGVFFRLWLLLVLSGEDIWVYSITQVTNLLEWLFLRAGLLTQPSITLVEAIAIALVFIQNIIYLFAVHLASWFLLDRLGNPIPRPPRWVQVLMDYED